MVNTFKCSCYLKERDITENEIKKDGSIFSKCYICRQKNKAYREANKEKIKNKNIEWKAKNKDFIKEYNRTYHLNKNKKID